MNDDDKYNVERIKHKLILFYDEINYNPLKIYVNIRYFREGNMDSLNTSEIATGSNMAAENTNEMDKYEVLSQQMVLMAKSVEKAVNNMPSICMNAMSTCMQKIDKVLELHNKKESPKRTKT